MNERQSFAHECLVQEIVQFCQSEGWPYNKYLELNGWYSFYVRRAFHNINGTSVATYDLANLNVELAHRGEGLLALFLDTFMEQARLNHRVLYVQNVLVEDQYGIYLRRGFEQVQTENPLYDVCFFYDPCDLVEEVEA